MAHYLTIPDVTDSEEFVSFRRSSDHDFDITLQLSHTATWLLQAAAAGTRIPLVVLVTDAMMIALDEVFVSSAMSSAEHGDEAYVAVTFNAEAVRFM